jgi:hypothetical protein
MNGPLVSVVIPCYNAERWIRHCLLSVLMQDYKNIEIIIVDDASTDKSASLIDLPQVKLIRNETNLGECRTSEKGFNAATGKYICRLSADDEFLCANHITRQVAAMEEHSLDWCYNSLSAVGPTIDRSRLQQSMWAPIPYRYAPRVLHTLDNQFLKYPNLCYLIAGFRSPVNSSALMIRADIFRARLSWDTTGLRSVCDGALLANILLHKLKGRALDNPGSFYRIHEAQATGTAGANKDLASLRRMIYEETVQPWYPFWLRLCSEIILLWMVK